MDRHITTHILDTSKGTPAAGVKLQLWRLTNERELVAEATSNADGRTDAPLVEGNNLTPGAYELVFHIADYFERRQAPRNFFYDTIPVRFVIPENPGRYHIPLLISPFGYSTYRGS